MSREQANIPFLGIDRRPLERQATPGLCQDITNLRPYGPAEEPFWEVVPEGTNLVYGQDAGLKRVFFFKGYILALTEDGNLQARRIELMGDNIAHEWDLGISGVLDASFASMGEVAAISISKDGQPHSTFFFSDLDGDPQDWLYPFAPPELPVVKVFDVETETSYTDEQLSAGSYKGLRSGFYYWRYAWRLTNGEHIFHSQPFALEITERSPADTFLRTLRLFFEGYEQTTGPDNLDFWKHFLSGVTIFVSPKMDDLGATDHEKNLKEALFYEVGRFDLLETTSDTRAENQFIDFVGREEDLLASPVMDIDYETHHQVSGKALFSYNNRLFMGNTGVNWELPSVHPFNSIWFARLLVLESGSDLTITVLSDHGRQLETGQLSTSAVSNLTSVTKNVVSNRVNTITATISSEPWSVTITYNEEGRKPFEVTVTDADYDIAADNFISGQGNLIPYSAYTEPSVTTRQVRIGVDIETLNGSLFKRVSNPFTVYPSTTFTGDPWEPAGGERFEGWLLWYPDSRATHLHVYIDDGSGGWNRVQTLKGSFSDKMNGAWFFNKYGGNQFATDPTFGTPVSLSGIDNDSSYTETNRLMVSELNYPMSFEPDRTYRVGSKRNQIIGYAVNALPVSEGQFGQYPVYVFLNNQIWALEQGRDPLVVFERISPVSTEYGLDNEQATVNIGRSVVFLYKNRLFELRGAQDPQPVNDPVLELMEGGERLGYFNDGTHEELWVAGDAQTLVYNLGYGRWYTLDRVIHSFMRNQSQLYSYRDDGNFYDEENPAEAQVAIQVSISMDPIHFGYPDRYKRLFATYFRVLVESDFIATLTFRDSGHTQQNETGRYYMKPRKLSQYSYGMDITATMNPFTGQHIHRIDTEFELRLPHKLRRANV